MLCSLIAHSSHSFTIPRPLANPPFEGGGMSKGGLQALDTQLLASLLLSLSPSGLLSFSLSRLFSLLSPSEPFVFFVLRWLTYTRYYMLLRTSLSTRFTLQPLACYFHLLALASPFLLSCFANSVEESVSCSLFPSLVPLRVRA